MSKLIGLIRECKTPPDSRVVLTPEQCIQIQDKYGVKILVQSYPGRCYSDDEYKAAGVEVVEDVSNCDILLGVKEVLKERLIANKVYFFFSHTIKAQSYNRGLLRQILRQNIQLCDHEVLTNEKKARVIAFGRFAGIVGAHNGIMTYGNRTKTFQLPQMCKFPDYAAALEAYKSLKLPADMRIVLTGTGRVSNGSAEVLDAMGIKKISAQEFLEAKESNGPVYCQISCDQYASPKTTPNITPNVKEAAGNFTGAGGSSPLTTSPAFDKKDFYLNPQNYESSFAPFTKLCNLMINGIYWDNAAPAFFTNEAMKADDFKIRVIADITCDIAPVASIPSTLKASTIADPVFGYDPETQSIVAPYQAGTKVVDVMSVDNLPNELPRDASKAFGEQFLTHVADELFGRKNTGMIERATIAKDGKLQPLFSYLTDYVANDAARPESPPIPEA